MILDPTKITVDIKIQDRLRQWFSLLMSKNLISLQCIMLGDSDIDYEMSYQINNSRILNSPYNVQAIKYPLIYNGLGKGIKGVITTFVRYIDSNGDVSSYYNYPLDTTLTIGRVPPTLKNGYDIPSIEFTNSKMGTIIFIQSLLDYYRTDDGTQQRLKESYDVKILFNGSQTVPNGWQVIYDNTNGSLLLGKDNIPIQFPSIYNGEIIITGMTTQLQKVLNFKF